MALRMLLCVVVLLLTMTCDLTQGELVMPVVRRMERSEIVFPDHPPRSNHREAVRPHVAPPVDDALELPEDISMLDLNNLHLLNGLTNISDFASFFSLELPPDPVESLDINTRFGGVVSDTVELAEMANCKPELVTVPLDLPTERNAVYFPTCVRVEQCGGCCYGPLLTCRPTVTKVVRFKVMKAQAGGGASTDSSSVRDTGSERRGRPTRRRRRQSSASFHEVEVVKHTACACGCKVQEQDCDSAIHTYFEGECACQCKNRDEKVKCERDGSKYWDNDTCACYCRNTMNCSSGEFFSHASCRCELVSARSGVGASAGGDAVHPDLSQRNSHRTPRIMARNHSQYQSWRTGHQRMIPQTPRITYNTRHPYQLAGDTSQTFPNRQTSSSTVFSRASRTPIRFPNTL